MLSVFAAERMTYLDRQKIVIIPGIAQDFPARPTDTPFGLISFPVKDLPSSLLTCNFLFSQKLINGRGSRENGSEQKRVKTGFDN